LGRVTILALVALTVALTGCDHATKHLAEERLEGEPPVELVSGVLDLSYTENRGVAFNYLRAVPYEVRRPLLLIVGGITLPLLVLLWYVRRRAPWPEQLAFSLLLAGALGNNLDRLLKGYVVDFIHLHHWPVFNVADVCLVAGTGLLLVQSLTRGGMLRQRA
jgi:signal peptidase II